MIKSSECLQPLYNLPNDQLLDSGYIDMDETRVQVLKEPDKTAESLSYIRVRKTGDRKHPIILFYYESGRSTDVAASLLGTINATCKPMIARVITALDGKKASQY
ncbi:MAG: transposase [Gammaproteobacteria bacterium]|jgi:transposase